MKDIYKSIQLGIGYIKYLGSNPKARFEDYLRYLVSNKEILEEYVINQDINAFRIVNINFLNVTRAVIFQPSSILLRPEGMSQDDVFKVISFVYKNMHFGNSRLINDLEIILTRKFGFKCYNSFEHDNVVDLFFIGDLLEFIHSKYYDRYFSWFNNDVTFDDINSIYKDIDPEITLKLKKNCYFKPYK